MNNFHRQLTVLFVWMLLTSCSSAAPAKVKLPTSNPVAPASPSTRTPTNQTRLPGPTQSPTVTPSPSLSPTETPSIFNPVKVIGPENAAHLVDLAQVADGGVSDMAFSADGKKLYITSPPDIFYYDAVTLRRTVFISDEHIWWQLLALSPDGKSILFGSFYQASLLDMATGQKQRTFDLSNKFEALNPHVITLLSWSGDGKSIAMGSEPEHECSFCGREADRLNFFNSGNGESLGEEITFLTKTFDSQALTGLAASPDGSMFAASQRSGSIVLYDAHSGLEIRKLPASNYYESVVFSPDGKTLAFGTYFGEITFWDLAGNAEIRTVTDISGPVQILKYSPDGRLLYDVSRNGWLSIWDTSSGDLLGQINPLGDGPGFIRNHLLAVSPAGKMLAMGSEGSAIVFLAIP